MPTPLINSLRVQGGTLYTSISASRDISKTFPDDDAQFVFSKFALLDLPDVQTPSGNYENYIVWEGIGSKIGGGTSSVPSLNADENINIAQSFQNYVLNFEQLVLNGDNILGAEYDNSVYSSVTERLFWKWLCQINAIRFRSATIAESPLTRYTEEDQTSYYHPVVKYLGDIDVINNVSKDGNTYSEVYLHVPTSHGNTPLILFKTHEDVNYTPGTVWTNGNPYLDGRDSGSVHPSGLSLIAYYDNDTTDKYVAGTTFGNIGNWTGTAAISGGSSKPVLLSQMDGIVLDFDPNSYQPILDDASISILSEYNATSASGDFRFNAALIYYDIYSASDPTNKATNLYGILILDDYVNEGGGYSYLKRFDKFKPNPITKANGNSYGLKFNLQFGTSVENAGIVTVINDYNTFSMDLFADAIIQLQLAGNMFLDQKLALVQIQQQIAALEQFYFSQDDLTLIAQRLSALETNLNNAKLSFQSSTTLLDLINKVADDVNLILNGQLSTQLSYNTDILKSGDGVLLDKSVPNQIKIVNRNQQYNNFCICKNTSKLIEYSVGNGTDVTDVDANNILVLGKFNNYFRQDANNTNPVTLLDDFSDNVIVNVDDGTNRWKTGQTLRIVFNHAINLNGYNIQFYTDSKNIFGGGAYEKLIGSVSITDLISNKPIIEIICIDENAYTFNIDIIR